MKREPFVLAALLALASGCATVVHGPYQDVRLESNPPGATATVAAQTSERGPLFLDDKKQKVTTPATVRLRRDNTYRVEFEMPGYKLGNAVIVSEYDWLWAPISCGPCEAVGELPTYDMSDRNVAVRFAQAAFYEYPVGMLRGFGQALRIFSPDALLGNSFKLKAKDSGYWSDWHALGTPEIVATLEPK